MVLNEGQVEDLAEVFKMLGDGTRLRIMLALFLGRMAVGEIAERLGLSQSLVSHNLRLMKAVRLVRGSRLGKKVLYEVDDQHVLHMLKDMVEHIKD